MRDIQKTLSIFTGAAVCALHHGQHVGDLVPVVPTPDREQSGADRGDQSNREACGGK
jgi:hypothetical protein